MKRWVARMTETHPSTSKATAGGEARVDRDRPYPPILSKKKKSWLWFFFYPLFAVSLIFLLVECSVGPLLSEGPCLTYCAFSFLLVVAFIDQCFRHDMQVHERRLEDVSEVQATFVEARTVEPRLTGEKDRERPQDYDKKVEQLVQEIERLETLGSRAWTEYQVLSLNQMLVEFLKEGELKARARSSLDDLEDYAGDSAFRYDTEHYYKRQGAIEEAIDSVKGDDSESDRDGKAEPLRAELRTLLEYVAGYRKNWAEGSAMIRALIGFGVTAIPVLLFMGLLPILPTSNEAGSTLGILSWGLLGMAGALTTVCRKLNRSDLVEVGNTEGRKEVWRAALGATLGLVAGILVFSMLIGGLFPPGGIVPDPMIGDWPNIGRSIVWAFVAGLGFESVFDRANQSTLSA